MSGTRDPLPIGGEDEPGEIEDIEEIDGEGDEPEPEENPDGDSPEGEEDEPEPRETRRSSTRDTIRSLRERSQTAERQLADLQRTVEDLRTSSTQRPLPDPYAQQRAAEAERAEQERVAQLPWEEQQRYWTNRTENRVAQAMQNQEFRFADRLDKAAFDLSAQSDAGKRRLAAEVERVLSAERAAGRNADRDIVYAYLRGQEVIKAEREGKGIRRQRDQATERVRRQTTRPGNGRGGAAPQSGNGRSTGEDADLRFLRNTRIGDVA